MGEGRGRTGYEGDEAEGAAEEVAGEHCFTGGLGVVEGFGHGFGFCKV